MKNIKPSAELINAAKQVIKARAICQTLKPKIEKIKADLLAQVQPKDEEGNLVSFAHYWMMTDEYAAIYYPAYNAAIKEAGYDVPEDHCPLLMAENTEREAVREMNRMAVSLVAAQGIKINPDEIYDLDLYKKLTELNLSYISQFIKR